MIIVVAGSASTIAASEPAVAPPLAEPLREGIPPAVEGLIYKDAATGVIIYVETDGRHVAAISPDGKLLWRKDPFIDAGMRSYRLARPTIARVGPAPNWTPPGGALTPGAAISYDSSQFGVINIADGRFTFLGQN
jgi:hypothetical protein